MSIDIKKLPKLHSALEDRYPNLDVSVCQMVRHEHGDRIPLQVFVVTGTPDDVCAVADMKLDVSTRRYVDQYGTRWVALKNNREGQWRAYSHTDTQAPDVPPGARHWPLKGVEQKVSRMLARIAKNREVKSHERS